MVDSLKISIINTHSFPTPHKTHLGNIVIVDLCNALNSLGHEVTFFTPKGSVCEPGVVMKDMPCAWGKALPSSQECEDQCFQQHKDYLLNQDIIHDFSISKRIVEHLYKLGKRNTVSTLLGGACNHASPPHNIIAWSEAQKDRIMRGKTDYENTPFPNMGGFNVSPVNNVRVVNGGIDTDFYTPTYEKKNFFLWMNRWHKIKGYKQAIELAKITGIELVLAGEHPDNELFDYQRNCALEAVELSKNLPNVKIQFLPPDPDHHLAKRELYRQAKGLLYTTIFNEPFGLAQVEALACGTPVIATNYGSMPEIIRNGITGFVRENNLKSLSHAIEMIDIIKLENCRKDAVVRFDKKVMALNYINLYKQIILESE